MVKDFSFSPNESFYEIICPRHILYFLKDFFHPIKEVFYGNVCYTYLSSTTFTVETQSVSALTHHKKKVE